MLCTNMTETDKLPPLITGKAKHQSALKKKGVTLAELEVDYYQSKRGWMTLAIFCCWLKAWNEKLAKQRHNILLLVGSAPSHMVDMQYSNIRIVFLLNTTSKQQPLDQGIIRVVKMFYHKAITKRILAHVDKDKEELKEVMKALDFVVTCKNIVAAWNYLTDTLIQKHF